MTLLDRLEALEEKVAGLLATPGEPVAPAPPAPEPDPTPAEPAPAPPADPAPAPADPSATPSA